MLISASVVTLLLIWYIDVSHFLLTVDAAVCVNYVRMFPKFEGCLYALIVVILNGCLDNVDMM